MNDKSLYRIALTQIKGVGVMHARNLMDVIGDEEAIFKEDARKLESIPRITRRLIQEIRDPEVLRRAEKELEFVIKTTFSSFFTQTTSIHNDSRNALMHQSCSTPKAIPTLIAKK